MWYNIEPKLSFEYIQHSILGGGAFKKINDDEDEMDNKLAGFALRGVPQASSASWNLKF